MNESEKAATPSGKKSDNYYSIKIQCCNCSFETVLDVLKGKNSFSAYKDYLCPNCEVKGDWTRMNRYWITED